MDVGATKPLSELRRGGREEPKESRANSLRLSINFNRNVFEQRMPRGLHIHRKDLVGSRPAMKTFEQTILAE